MIVDGQPLLAALAGIVAFIYLVLANTVISHYIRHRIAASSRHPGRATRSQGRPDLYAR